MLILAFFTYCLHLIGYLYTYSRIRLTEQQQLPLVYTPDLPVLPNAREEVAIGLI